MNDSPDPYAETTLAEARDLLDLQSAETHFAAGDCLQAIPRLARLLRRNPANPVAAQRLIAALSQRDFALPVLVFPQTTAIAFSPDGRQLLTASGKTVTLRNARTGCVQARPLDHSDSVLLSRFSPDGNRLVTVAWDKTARLWDARSGEPVCSPLQHQGYVRVAEFSPDGQRLLTASDDGVVRVWDVQTGTVVLGSLRHEGVNGVAYIARFSPDGGRILTVCEPQACVHLWDARTGLPLARPIEHNDQVVCAEFSPDGEILLTVTDGPATLRVWDPKTGTTLATIGPQHASGDSVASAQFSPDGGRILVATHGNSALIYDTQTGEPTCASLGHRGRVSSAEFSADGLQVLTASEDHTVRVWDTQTGRQALEPMLHHSAVYHAIGSADGRYVATRCKDHSAWVWELRTGQLMNDLARESTSERRRLMGNAQFSRDGDRLVTLSGGSAQVLGVANGQPLGPPLLHEAQIDFAALSPDGRLLVTSWHGAGTNVGYVRLWDVQTGQSLSDPLAHEGYMGQGPKVAFSTDGTRFVTACGWNFLGYARVWDTATRQPVTEPLPHKQQVYCALFSPDGRKVLTTSTDGARLWDTSTGAPLTQPMQQDGCVHSAAFSPDGHRIVTASADHSARIWDAQTGRPILETLIHEGEVWHAEFSPDGQRILTVSGDRTARLWDAHTGEMRVPPLVHQSPVRCGVFSADGRRIATGCSDGSVRVWDAETGLSLSDPIHLPAPLHTVRFDRDGKRLVLVPAWGALRSWDLGVAPVPCDPWIPDLAEAVAGCRYGRRWLLEPVPFEDSLALRDRIRALSDSGFYTTWAQWFLAPIDNRTLSASSPTATADYIQRRIQDDSIESLWEAVRLSRTNALALARLAQLFTMPTGTDDPTRAGQAEFLSRRAARLAPHDPAVTKTLDEIDGLRRFLRSRPTSPDILPQP